MDPKVKPHTRQTLVETFDQANYNSTPEYNVALETLLTYHVSICTAECSFSGMKPGGGGVLDISLGGEVRRGPSYPDTV